MKIILRNLFDTKHEPIIFEWCRARGLLPDIDFKFEPSKINYGHEEPKPEPGKENYIYIHYPYIEFMNDEDAVAFKISLGGLTDALW